jgi:septal ring factor EnvC (AmiA/AmiB activator)
VDVGLLIWALTIRSDLDSTQQDVDQLESQLDQSKETGSTVASAIKTAYDDLVAQLGSTQEDLAASEQEINDAKDAQAKAEQDAEAAK